MHHLSHRIKIFVFRLAGPEPRYLLLKPDQGIEALWGPLQAKLEFGDKLESAVSMRIGRLRPSTKRRAALRWSAPSFCSSRRTPASRV